MMSSQGGKETKGKKKKQETHSKVGTQWVRQKSGYLVSSGKVPGEQIRVSYNSSKVWQISEEQGATVL